MLFLFYYYCICNGWYSHLQHFIISAIFCHKSHSRKSNGSPCWLGLHHIQKWKKYCRCLVHSSDCVCSKDTNRPKYIPYWPGPCVFSIDVLLSQKSKINNPIRKVIHFRVNGRSENLGGQVVLRHILICQNLGRGHTPPDPPLPPSLHFRTPTQIFYLCIFNNKPQLKKFFT